MVGSRDEGADAVCHRKKGICIGVVKSASECPSQEVQCKQTSGRCDQLGLVKGEESRGLRLRLPHSLEATLASSNSYMTKRPHSPDTPDAKMQTNGDTEPQDGREPKRRRSAPLPLDINVALSMKPERNIDVVEDGDVLLVVNKFNDEEKP